MHGFTLYLCNWYPQNCDYFSHPRHNTRVRVGRCADIARHVFIPRAHCRVGIMNSDEQVRIYRCWGALANQHGRGRHGLAATAPPPADEGALSGDARRDSTSFAAPAINFHAAKSLFSGGAASRSCVAPRHPRPNRIKDEKLQIGNCPGASDWRKWGREIYFDNLVCNGIRSVWFVESRFLVGMQRAQRMCRARCMSANNQGAL